MHNNPELRGNDNVSHISKRQMVQCPNSSPLVTVRPIRTGCKSLPPSSPNNMLEVSRIAAISPFFIAFIHDVFKLSLHGPIAQSPLVGRSSVTMVNPLSFSPSQPLSQLLGYPGRTKFAR